MKLPPNVILIGTMGAGKTSTGKELARILKFEFWDMDQWIEQKSGQKVREIFEEKGEPFFRQQETNAIDWLVDKNYYVISTGGGVWNDPKNREKLLRRGWCVWLKVTAKGALHRVGLNLEQRPLLASSSDPLATVQRLLNEREPFYSLAHERVETDGKTPGEVALEIHRKFLETKPFEQGDTPPNFNS